MRCPGDRTRPEGSASSGVIISTPVAVEVGGLLPVVVGGGGGGGGGGRGDERKLRRSDFSASKVNFESNR